ncbi:MAG TPA: DUF393 domain-containing protein [Geothermobacteraceae bacterium]|nr:DUF393 domain-containing protein [Geothermobacteraceae bacterium]
MPGSPIFPLQVLYDGGCSVCAAAIKGYARRQGGEQLLLVDITAADFDPESFGLSRDELLYQLHAIDRAGTIYRGVEALRAIWLAFPPGTLNGLLGRLLSFAPLRPPARLGYWCFARLRRFLPQPKSVCKIGRRPPR